MTENKLEERFWFKRKRYGWGWTPATWEGWLILVIWVIVTFAPIILLDSKFLTNTLVGIKSFVAYEVAIVLALLLVCWKTGESPRWQWGDKK